ncbi:replication/maintenance protein RepL [Salinicoccus roseus]|uniref:replication/maintenance protein RepL n=1 Tax=Salinicoccus roseus TaxID=45670 RepID=UPI002300E590|nr:replication/maintenance protein RepL [Salinicoccus roseus]
MTTQYEIVSFTDYQNFDSIKEMDETVRQFNARISRVHYETLNLLKQYSCKIIGVSHLKVKTIAQALNRSVRAIHRHLKYLKDNGFITVANTSRRKAGGKGANVYIINTVDQQKAVQKKKVSYRKVSYREQVKKTVKSQQAQAFAYIKVKKQTMYSLKLLNSIFSSTTRKYKRMRNKLRLERIENIKSATFDNHIVPKRVYQQFNPFFSDAQLTALYKTAMNSLNTFDLDADQQTEALVYALESLVKAMKRHHRGQGEPVYNIYAYLHRTMLHIGFNAEFYNDIYAYTDAAGFRKCIS